jgi:hypothetical protein
MLHITARMRLLKTKEGGRASWVRSRYRPNIRFGDLYTDGALDAVRPAQRDSASNQYSLQGFFHRLLRILEAGIQQAVL